MKNNARLYSLLIIITLLMNACNLPSSGGTDTASTAAAQTIEALLSAIPPTSSAVSTPTFTPVASAATLTPISILTNTPVASPTSNCNVMQFITDVTIPDGTIVAPGTAFTKTWRLKNVGTCTWTPSYAVVFSDGNSMNGPSTQTLTGNVNPGQTVDISVNLTAPASTGDYTGNWKIRDAAGVLFGKFYVQIKSQNPVTATYTLPPAIVFAVTSVTFNITSNCPNFNYTANITTNGAGTVNLHRVFGNGGTDSTPRTLTFASAGTQSFTEAVYFGVAGSSTWVDIYIDSPNNQQFGRATFSCP